MRHPGSLRVSFRLADRPWENETSSGAFTLSSGFFSMAMNVGRHLEYVAHYLSTNKLNSFGEPEISKIPSRVRRMLFHKDLLLHPHIANEAAPIVGCGESREPTRRQGGRRRRGIFHLAVRGGCPK